MADLGGGHRGPWPPKRFKKKIFLHHLKKSLKKKFCYVTLVFKELRLLDYTPALEIWKSGRKTLSTTPPPSNSRNPSTTPPPRNRAGKLRQLPPPSNSRNPSTTPPPLEIGPPQLPPPRIYGRTEIRSPQIQFLDPPLVVGPMDPLP